LNKPFTGILFLPSDRLKRKKEDECLPANAVFVNVSARGADGWNALSPFYDHGGIPVPGMPGKLSKTVEGLWQGLMRFPDQREKLEMFETGKPTKRKGTPLGYVYGSEFITGVVQARKLIYVPAFRWMVENCPEAQAKYAELLELAKTHWVLIHDTEKNGKIDVDLPFAHASLLADMVNAELKKMPVAP
jgi:hypothetical protein